MGGGNRVWPAAVAGGGGLSPRGRGNPPLANPSATGGRSIPAWAGETRPLDAGDAFGGVYPRVGGETRGSIKNRYGGRVYPRVGGETGGQAAPPGGAGVYPRVGGGNFGQVADGLDLRGLSRVGGGNLPGFVRVAVRQGLSPRGRGKRDLPFRSPPALRSIPAWAGETPGRGDAGEPLQVYPRVGGGNAASSTISWPKDGLSPRGRGKPRRLAFVRRGRRSIPAWAGETACGLSRAKSARVYPRVGGGNQGGHLSPPADIGLSPRGRGKPANGQPAAPTRRSIPAWAGETPGSRAGRGG